MVKERKTWADFLHEKWLNHIQTLLGYQLDRPIEDIAYTELEILGMTLRPAWLACRQLKLRKRKAAARILGKILGVPEDMMECGALRHIAHKVLVVNGDIVTFGRDFARIVLGSLSIDEPLVYLADYGITFDQWAREQFEEIYWQLNGGRPRLGQQGVNDLVVFLTDGQDSAPSKDVGSLLEFLGSI